MAFTNVRRRYWVPVFSVEKLNASFPNILVLWKRKNSIRFFCSIIRTTTHYTTFINHNNKLSVDPTFITDKFYQCFSLRLTFCKLQTEQIKIISQTNVWQLFSIIFLFFLFTFLLFSCLGCHPLFSIETVEFFNNSIVL